VGAYRDYAQAFDEVSVLVGFFQKIPNMLHIDISTGFVGVFVVQPEG
jgi:hypothetical protein